MARVKISIIGAGSVVFSLGLVKDLCATKGLSGSHVCFMDIDQGRLDMIHQLGTRYAKEMGSALTFEKTLDRQVALQDADFVINTAAVHDEYVKHDIRTVTDSHGYYYGGRMRLLFYQIDLMLSIARDMERLCPDARLIFAANPVFEGTTLISRETCIKTVGLCHGHYGYRRIAAALGLDPDKITFQAPGFNHHIWMTHFIYQGADGSQPTNAYSLLNAWIENEAEKYWAEHVATGTHDAQMSRAAIHQYKMYGLMPIGDTVRRGGWWYHTDKETKMDWFFPPWGGPDTHEARAVTRQSKDAKIAKMTEAAFDPKISLIELFGAGKTREQHIPIIDGLVNNNTTIAQVNVRNDGALPGIPDDVAVEVPAIVDITGIQPLRVEPLPQKLMLTYMLPVWLRMEQRLYAYLNRDRSVLLYRVLDNHQTRSYDQAAAALEDILGMECNAEMNAHYQWPQNWGLP